MESLAKKVMTSRSANNRTVHIILKATFVMLGHLKTALNTDTDYLFTVKAVSVTT